MKESLLDILRCPECKSELDLTVEEESKGEEELREIEEGTLHCKNCDIVYPIENGIPNMLPQDE
ncbi:MAG: methytransferase partner Trm112 [Candidatus Thermoplasmatota archaeon]|nr:methytransferase partner Trm112 [Candidatus Thermoplasmatota archaeon]